LSLQKTLKWILSQTDDIWNNQLDSTSKIIKQPSPN
jgi:hypothetical protein